MSTTASPAVYPVTATRRTFANLTSTWVLGYHNRELEVTSRDPQEVMSKLPDDVICFRFYDRIVADTEVDGETVRIQSEHLNFSEEEYFVDVKKVYERRETFGWWKWDYYKDLRKTMDRKGTDHVVAWGDPTYALAYRPDVDVLLYR